MKKIILALVILCLGLGISYATTEARERAKITIKIATLAPKGSAMANITEEFRAEVREKTNNEVGFKVYWGGVQGDETDVLRKIRLKQLHGGAFTGHGLSEIVPEVRVTEIPYAFRNDDEVSYVRAKLADTMNKYFEDQGYVVIGWNNIGFVYAFSSAPVTSVEELRQRKCWVWGDDALAHEVYKVLGITPIPLSVTDVLTSLSTKLIDHAAITPFGAVAFRWYTRFKYMTDFPIINALGALVVTKEIWDKISPESQKEIRQIAKGYFDRITKAHIEADERCIEILKKAGISIAYTTQDSEINYKWRLDVGRKARENLIGRLYSRELLERTLSLIDEYRKDHPDSAYKIIK